MTYPETSDHHHYVSMRDGSRSALLLGPYPTRQDAESNVERAREEAVRVDPRAHFYGFGTARLTARRPRLGILNGRIGLVAR